MNKSMMLFAAAACVFCAEAKIEMGVPFADGMVLQRERDVPVWGKADPGENVTVEFAGQSLSAKAGDNGEWMVKLSPMKTSCESRSMKVKGASEEKVINDILVGEVWFCAGQSNTELPLTGFNPHFRDGKGTMRAQLTNKPLLRYCKQGNYQISATPKKVAPRPVEWLKFTTENLIKPHKTFSAMGVYFALELYNVMEIPVGIVGTYWGGTRVEPWTPKSGLASVGATQKMANDPIFNTKEELLAAKAEKKTIWNHCNAQPQVLWNEMVNPWTPFAIRGFIWYQGCSNAGEGHGYADKMHALYNGWATEFKNPDLKLYFVQLAPWGNSNIAAIQEGQAIFAAAEKNAGMAVINDIGNITDIHPSDKETVGQRLALLALNRDYGYTNINADSPRLATWRIEGEKFVLTFDFAKSLYLYNRDFSAVTPFEIAGADGKFYPAKIENLNVDKKNPNRSNGQISGKELIVVAPEVKEPKKLRYNFSHPWLGTIYNESNLPLGAFHIGD